MGVRFPNESARRQMAAMSARDGHRSGQRQWRQQRGEHRENQSHRQLVHIIPAYGCVVVAMASGTPHWPCSTHVSVPPLRAREKRRKLVAAGCNPAFVRARIARGFVRRKVRVSSESASRFEAAVQPPEAAVGRASDSLSGSLESRLAVPA